MGRRSWLDKALQDKYFPAIAQLEDHEDGWAQAAQLGEDLRESWAERGLSSLEQQQSLMDITRRAIKDRFGADHFSLDYIAFSTEEYTELNDIKQGRVAQRNTQCVLLDPGCVNALIARSVNLLNSPEWADIAAALAVLTGRRSTEVLATAQFSKKSEYSVIFTGAIKRRGEEQLLSFEIPTLAQADYVLKGLAKLRQLVNVESLSRQQINARFGKKVATACDLHFADLIPTRPDEDNLYSHLFRSVYATIAVWFYCPVNVDATEFKAHCQGHFAVLDAHNPELRRQLASSRHYSDFKISDGKDNIDGRQGIRLSWHGVEVLEVFKDAAIAPLPSISERKQISSLRFWKENHGRIVAILNLFPGKTIADRVEAWLEWSERQITDGVTPVEEIESNETEGEGEGAIAPLDIRAEESQVEQGAIDQGETIQMKVQGDEAETQEAIVSVVEPIDPEDKLDPILDENLDPAQSDGQPMAITPKGELLRTASPLEHQLGELVAVLKQFVEIQAASSLQQPGNGGIEAQETPARPRKRRVRSSSEADKDLSQQEDQSSRIGRKRGEDDDLIDQAMSAIIAYNDAPDRTHDQKWFLTANLLKKFTPNNNQRAAQRRLDTRADEVLQHHQKHQLQPDHNHRHKKHDIMAILQI